MKTRNISIKFLMITCLLFPNICFSTNIGDNRTLFSELFGQIVFNVDEDGDGTYEREEAFIGFATSHGYTNVILNKFSAYPDVFSKTIVHYNVVDLALEDRIGNFLHDAHAQGISKIGIQGAPHSSVGIPSYFFSNVNEFNKRMLALHDATYCFDIIYTELDWWYGDPSGDPHDCWMNYFYPGIAHMYGDVKDTSNMTDYHPLLVATYIGNLDNMMPDHTPQNLADTLDENTDWIFVDFYINGDKIPQTVPLTKFFDRDDANGQRLLLLASNNDPTYVLPLFSAESSTGANNNFFGDNLDYDNGYYYHPVIPPALWDGNLQEVKDQFQLYFQTDQDPYNTTATFLTMEQLTPTNDMSEGVGWFKHGCMPDAKLYMSLPEDDLNVTTCTYILTPDEIITTALHNTTNYLNPNNVHDDAGITATIVDYKWYKNGVLQTAYNTFPSLSLTLLNNVTENWTCEIQVNSSSVGFFANLKFRDDINLSGETIAVTAGADNSTICEGDPVTFTATPTGGGSYTYQWQLNGIDIPGANGVDYTPTTPFTSTDVFDVVLTAAGLCGAQVIVYSNPVSVTVNPVPPVSISANGNDVSFCYGGDVELTATAPTATAFQWYNSLGQIAGEADPSYTASIQETYYCEVTNSYGCTSNSNSIAVTVFQNPVITITASGNCIGSELCADPSNLTAYLWAPFGQTIACITANDPVVYDVLVTDALGCTGTASYDFSGMDMSCCGNYPITIAQSDFNAAFLPPGSYNLSTSVQLTQDIILSGCTLAIAPGVSITTNGFNLTIDQSSWLYACREMWQGIVNTGGGMVVIDGALGIVKIDDAFTAISSTNSDMVQIDGAIFDQNWIGVSLSNGTFVPPSTYIHNTTFRCTGGYLPYPPMDMGDPVPYAHVHLDNVADFILGDDAVAQYSNNLYTGGTGVNARNSNFTVVNCNFDYTDNGALPLQVTGATAILAHGPALDQNSYIVNVGGSGPHQPNNFRYWGNGVYTQGVGEVYVTHNTFNNCKSGSVVSLAYQTDQSFNVFESCNYGISVLDGILPFQVSVGTYYSTVDQNTFNISQPAYDPNNYGNTAIFGNTQPRNTGNGLLITANTIINYAIGIHVNNAGVKISNHNSYDTWISNVDLTFNHYGIWVQNSSGAQILNNDLNWSGGTADVTLLGLFKGIAIELVKKGTLKENTITNIPAGINVFDDCAKTNLLCNDMEFCYHGVYMDPMSLTSMLTVQGVFTINPNTSVSWDNKWHGNISFKVGGSVPQFAFILWGYDPAAGADYNPSPSAPILASFMANLHNGCAIPHPPGPKKISFSGSYQETLYPNPAISSVTFEKETAFGDYETIAIYNYLQQRIIEYKLPANASAFAFDISNIPQGIYLVKHFSAGLLVSENKLVIIK